MNEEILKKLRTELEEYGELHNENCGVNMEEECNCFNIEVVIDECKKALDELNNYWVVHLKAHRPYCSPQGNKELTKIKRLITPAIKAESKERD